VSAAEEAEMQRIACALALLGALACGSGEPEGASDIDVAAPSGTAGSAAGAGSSGTAGSAAGAGSSGTAERAAGALEPAAAIADSAHPSAARCLDLVRQERLIEAVAPCTEAVRNAPDDREVAAALERAQSGARSAAADQAAAAQSAAADQAAAAQSTASDAASDAAAGAVEDAAGSLSDAVPTLPQGRP